MIEATTTMTAPQPPLQLSNPNNHAHNLQANANHPVRERELGMGVQNTERTHHLSVVKPMTEEEKIAQEEKDRSKTDPNADFGKMLSELDTYVQKFRRELQFLKDQDNGQLIIKVVNKDTNEVIRQIPSEEIIELHKRLEEAAGIIIKVKA